MVIHDLSIKMENTSKIHLTTLRNTLSLNNLTKENKLFEMNKKQKG